MLSILAGENKVLEELAVNSDKALKPLAAVREHVAKFIVESNKTAQAGANTRAALARSLELFPPSWNSSCRPSSGSGSFAEATTPTMEDLGAARARHQQDLHEHPRPSRPARKSSSKTSARPQSSRAPRWWPPSRCWRGSRSSATRPCRRRPTSRACSASFRNTGGLERLLDFIFLGTGAANGYDALGHFLRTEGLGTICTEYKTAPTSSCARKLFEPADPDRHRGLGLGPASAASVSAGINPAAAGGRDGAHARGDQRRYP